MGTFTNSFIKNRENSCKIKDNSITSYKENLTDFSCITLRLIRFSFDLLDVYMWETLFVYILYITLHAMCK